MLIRSQDKQALVNLDNFDSIFVVRREKRNVKTFKGEDDTMLGQYTSEEKAIKVLNEIQCQYARFSCRYGSDCSYDAVYNMPQDSEV